MMWYWNGGMPWWGWLLGALMMLVFWGRVIWGIWYLVTGVGRGWDRPPADPGPPVPPASPTPRQILDERLARGDISADEYRHLVEVMNEGRAHGVGGREPVGTSTGTG